MKLAEHRWRTYVDAPADLEWLKGDQLLHTDYNPLNVLMSDGQALLIDWAWPTRGAGWIDPACIILRLIANGHSATSAEQVVETVPTWRAAPTKGLAVFAQACVRIWKEIADDNPVEWIENMAEAAHVWAVHRQATTVSG